MKILGTYYLTETIPHYPYKVNLDFLIDLDFQLNFGIIKGRAVLEGHSPEMFKGKPVYSRYKVTIKFNNKKHLTEKSVYCALEKTLSSTGSGFCIGPYNWRGNSDVYNKCYKMRLDSDRIISIIKNNLKK